MNIFRSVAVTAGLLVGAVQCSPATVAPPDATTPPAVAPVDGRCTQYEALLDQYAPPSGWDTLWMSAFMWRESRCNPALRSRTSDTGLLQINDVNLPYLRTALGEQVDRWTLVDPIQNVRAAAALCEFWVSAGRSCYRAWRT
jgi:hypothetical protein